MWRTEEKTPPLTRPKFTEEVQQMESRSDTEIFIPTTERNHELARLKSLPIVSAHTTIGMIVEYHNFPWTQDTMIAVGRSDEILKAFLEEHLEIEMQELRK